MSFHASEVAHELVTTLKPVWLRLCRRAPKLADQLFRAMSSIPLNVDEGRNRQGRDRINLWNYAAGSAGEVRSILRVAVSLGFEDPVALEPSLALLDRELAMLWRMTRARG